MLWVSTSTQTPTWFTCTTLYHPTSSPAQAYDMNSTRIRLTKGSSSLCNWEGRKILCIKCFCICDYSNWNPLGCSPYVKRKLFVQLKRKHTKMPFLTFLGVNRTARIAMRLNSLGFRPVVLQATPFTVLCIHVSSLHMASIAKHHHTSTKCWLLLVVVWLSLLMQWQNTSGSSQRCPGFDSQQLLAFPLSSSNI